MKFFSMFSGIGGFELGIDKAFGDNRGLLQKKATKSVHRRVSDNQERQTRSESWECIGYSEIDKYAEQVYRYQFGTEVRNYGDAKKINTDELPDFDLLCGGLDTKF